MACDARLEEDLRLAGYRNIAGVDEVGRGALAGPVVAAAVILNLDNVPAGIDDSKKLSRAKRERLAMEIEQCAVAFSVARVEHFEIDQINIHHASLLAMRLAAKALQPPPEYVLIDGKFKLPEFNCPQTPVVKGDGRSLSVAAASILAKVARDHWMAAYDEEYPGYSFASHVGYNTRVHQEAIRRLGPSAIHRMTFQGVRPAQRELDFDDQQASVLLLK